MSKGLRDKLYWRFVGDLAHCFKRSQYGYASLCGNYALPYTRGQACRRPEAVQRCAKCDVAEMHRRGWEESGPPSKEKS